MANCHLQTVKEALKPRLGDLDDWNQLMQVEQYLEYEAICDRTALHAR